MTAQPLVVPGFTAAYFPRKAAIEQTNAIHKICSATVGDLPGLMTVALSTIAPRPTPRANRGVSVRNLCGGTENENSGPVSTTRISKKIWPRRLLLIWTEVEGSKRWAAPGRSRFIPTAWAGYTCLVG